MLFGFFWCVLSSSLASLWCNRYCASDSFTFLWVVNEIPLFADEGTKRSFVLTSYTGHFLVPCFFPLIFIWCGATRTCACIPKCRGSKTSICSLWGFEIWPACLGLLLLTHVFETRLELVGADEFWRALGFLLCHWAAFMYCCVSSLMVEFITLWLSSGDKSDRRCTKNWCLVTPDDVSSSWLEFLEFGW